MVEFLAPAGDRPVCGTLLITGEGTYKENAADENGVMRANVERRAEVEIALRWGTGYERTVECFTNTIRNVHGGTHRKRLRARRCCGPSPTRSATPAACCGRRRTRRPSTTSWRA